MTTKFFIKVNKENKELLQKVSEILRESERANDVSEKEHDHFTVLCGNAFENDYCFIGDDESFKEISKLIENASDGSGSVYTELRDGTGFETITTCGSIKETHVSEENFKDYCAPLRVEDTMVLDIYFEGDKEADVEAVLGDDLCAKFGLIAKDRFYREDAEFANGATHYWTSLSQWDTITLADIKVMKDLIAQANERVASIGGKATYLIEVQTVDMDSFDILSGDACGAEFISDDGSEMLEIHFSPTGIKDVDFWYYE